MKGKKYIYIVTKDFFNKCSSLSFVHQRILKKNTFWLLKIQLCYKKLITFHNIIKLYVNFNNCSLFYCVFCNPFKSLPIPKRLNSSIWVQQSYQSSGWRIWSFRMSMGRQAGMVFISHKLFGDGASRRGPEPVFWSRIFLFINPLHSISEPEWSGQPNTWVV